MLSLEDCVLPSVRATSSEEKIVTRERWRLQFEIEGSVGEGILAAAWNPDSSLLVLVTGN